MFGVFSIICIFAIIFESFGNPVNITDVENLESQFDYSCDRNIFLISNQSLFELLNIDRFWFVLARSKFIYGEETWKNSFMKTTTTINGSTYLEFIGENSNGSCVSSEKGQIVSNIKSNRVSINWTNSEGFLDMIFLDETLTLYILCYSLDSNNTDVCAHNQTEQFIAQNNQLEYENDTLLWLKSHCPSINTNDFIVNDNSKKCLFMVIEPEIVDVNKTEQAMENHNKTMYAESIEEENVTVTPATEFEFTTRTNRTNRLEVLEEYYHNATDENQIENKTVMEIKEIVVLSANVSANDDADRTNVTIVEQIVLEPVVNETVVEEVPLMVLHKAVITETTTITTEVSSDNPETTQSFVTHSSKTNDSIEIDANTTTLLHPTSTPVTSTTEKQVFNQSTTSVHVENSTISVSTESETSTSTTETSTSTTETSTATTTETSSTVMTQASTTMTEASTTMIETSTSMIETSTTMIETTTELSTTEATTSTSTVPADCPVLKDCPFDYCAFARKLDNRGCPTCNCLQSDKSNITCPGSTCQTCLYGHYTDPNGCPVCQCQSRPYPPLGERCPQLNCEPCYFGTVKDEYNCDTCVCIRPNSQECPVLNCKFGPCKYGSIKDEDDCPTCDCLLPIGNGTEVNCSISMSCSPCHLGYVKDADGCETCQCKLRGNVPCISVSAECQCEYGSYLNADGCETCSCLPDPKNASRQACWELSNQANFHNISGPACGSDGLFYARQCDKTRSKCWCVTSTGIYISGFESRPEENVNCACAVELYQVSSLRMIGHHLLCLISGNYAPIQCDGRYCSCVDEYGKTIGPSVSIQNRDQLRCVGVYQQLHPERFLLHRATIEQSNGSRLPYGMFSSLCLTHLEQVRNTNITDDHILIPVCDENGLYASVQCDQTERYCWCVDKKTGVEMDGTRRLNARPNCNNV